MRAKFWIKSEKGSYYEEMMELPSYISEIDDDNEQRKEIDSLLNDWFSNLRKPSNEGHISIGFER